jgi:hypothetical protein
MATRADQASPIDLLTGMETFLFTDIEGSTGLSQEWPTRRQTTPKKG